MITVANLIIRLGPMGNFFENYRSGAGRPLAITSNTIEEVQPYSWCISTAIYT